MRTHLKLGVLLAVVAMAALAALTACGGDGGGEGWGWPPPDQETPTPEGREAVTPTDSTPRPERSNVPRLRCGTLMQLTDKDIEEALGEKGTWLHGQGEVCTKELVTDERFFVRMEPGAPGDLEPGADLLGVPGEPVSAVGDDARWFGGTGAEGGGTVGILSVRQSTSLGALHFRIALGRPDLSSAEQLDKAKNLALSALPRFPGVVVEQSEPGVVTSELEPVDLSNIGYVDNLLVKEETGEWTRGEGLVATLRLFAGEIEASQVLRHPELMDYSGTGVIQLAQEYLATGPDDEARTEIARLLDQLVPSREQLERASADGQASPDASSLFVSLGPVRQQDEEEEEGQDFCAESYNTDPPCLRKETSPELEALWPGKYVLFRPVSEVARGWTLPRIDAAVEAMRASAVKYEKLVEKQGGMPPVGIWLTGYETIGLTTNVGFQDGVCTILVHPLMQEIPKRFFQQFLARDIAYCLIAQTFPESGRALLNTRWWSDGLATYLSGVVPEYDDVNLEHDDLPTRLADHELTTPLLERSFTNWVFFEYLHPKIGTDGIFALIRGLPETLDSAVPEWWHPFNQKLTDADVPDIGGGTVPYKPDKIEVEISGSGEADFPTRPLGILRLHVEVTGGQVACVEYDEGGPVETSWRPGAPGPPGGAWSEDLPDKLKGESVFLITAIRSGVVGLQPKPQLTIKVKKVVDSESDCEEEEDESEPTPCPIELGCPTSRYYPEEG
jgi:hypothetical protein